MSRGRYLTPDTPDAGFICRLLRVPNSEAHLSIVNGALQVLTRAYNFEQEGSATPQETADAFEIMYEDYITFRGCMIGTIFAHANATAPLGSLPCDGATFLKSDYPLLYDSLDSAFIVDSTHARTPDLRGRSIVGVGSGSGLTTRALDDQGGEETHTLTVAEMPLHGHNSVLFTAVPAAAGPGLLVTITGSTTTPTTNTGGDGAHENMHPWNALHYAIWAQ